MLYEPDDEEFDESVETQTDMYPQQALEQPTVDDGVGLGRRRWSFGEHLLIAGLFAMLVIVALLAYRHY